MWSKCNNWTQHNLFASPHKCSKWKELLVFVEILPVCTHTHFGFVSVTAFSPSPQIAALWNGIQGPSGFLTMFQTFLSKMNSSVTSTLLNLKVCSNENVLRQNGSQFLPFQVVITLLLDLQFMQNKWAVKFWMTMKKGLLLKTCSH